MKNKFRTLFERKDLTIGGVPKVFSLFLIPIFLSILFQQGYTFIDTIVVGKFLPSTSLSGINAASPISGTALNIVIGITTGFSAIIGNKFGSKDEKGLKNSIFLQLFLSIVFSIVLSLTFFLLIDPLLSVMNIKNTTDKIMQMEYKAAKDYLIIYFSIGITTCFLYNFSKGCLNAIGDSFTPFIALVISSILNVFLDLLFVLVIKLDTLGAALATCIAQLISSIISIIYMFTKYKELRINKENINFSLNEIWKNLKMGIPLAIQWAGVYIGIICMTSGIIPFDFDSNFNLIDSTPAQVGYGVANKVSGILMNLLSAMSIGLSSFISQNNGANKTKRIKDAVIFSIIFQLVLSTLIVITLYLLMINETYQRIFLSTEKVTPDTIKYGNTYLFISLPFYWFLSLIDVGRGGLNGLEKPLMGFISGIIELIIRLSFTRVFPYLINSGPINNTSSFNLYKLVCFADPICWVVACLIVMLPLIITIYKMYKAEAKNNLNS